MYSPGTDDDGYRSDGRAFVHSLLVPGYCPGYRSGLDRFPNVYHDAANVQQFGGPQRNLLVACKVLGRKINDFLRAHLCKAIPERVGKADQEGDATEDDCLASRVIF